MSRLVCVPPNDAGYIWPLVKGLIESAMQKGGMGSFAQVENNVLHGPDLLWLAVEGDKIGMACITSLGADKVCTIVAAGGSFVRFGHLLSDIEQFAKDEGCKAMRICGRPGWRRLSGYRTKKVILEKAI